MKVQVAQLASEKELPADKHTSFRATAARSNYISADRPDIIFACKEVCRHMAQPTNLSEEALKRVSRFFEGRKRLVWRFPYQRVTHLDVYSDTDHAGCLRTRQSISGGWVMLGSHVFVVVVHPVFSFVVPGRS